jgi:putative ABC transport system ATP-binding protein
MIIRLHEVHKFYNRDTPRQVHAVRGVSLAVQEGEAVCISGPSGSGKSTLLGIIGGFFVPTSGLAEVAGVKLARLPDRFLTSYRRDYIGFIPQRFPVIGAMSVLANVILPLLPLGVEQGESEERGRQLLTRLNIIHKQNMPAAELSGGELQRLVIARALINDPPIILADEPTAHLDSALSTQFISIMSECRAEGKTVVIASHDPLVFQSSLIHRHLILEDGAMVAG